MTAVAGPTGLVDPELHAHGDPHSIWRWLREHAPVHWYEPDELPAFWALTLYEDIRTVYRDPETFSSEQGVLLRPTELGKDPGGGLTLALTDPPRHKQLRALMADFFARRSIRALEEYISTRTLALLRRGAEAGECDFVHDIAGRLSLNVICRIVGAPERDHEDIFQWTNEAFESHTSLVAHRQFTEYFAELMYQRMTDPTDDLLSALVNQTVDGQELTEEEILLNVENLVGATENGRLALIGALVAFLDYPEQWERLRQDRALLPTAIEEILRWTSSATHSMRTATRDVDLRGQRIRKGDRVVLWLPSANRDESVFPDPFRFDIARRPNRHIALATGEHFCIGSVLARSELRILLSGMLDAEYRIEQLRPAVRLCSIAVNGPISLPVRITAT